MRPRPESVRPRPKLFCEAEAKTYEAEAEDTVSVMQHINTYYFHIAYKTDSSQTELR